MNISDKKEQNGQNGVQFYAFKVKDFNEIFINAMQLHFVTV